MACWRSGLTHQPFTLAFTGSNPVHVIFIRAFSSAGRASALQAECRRFDPVNAHFFAGVAQLAEQLICNQQVAGSSPITSSTIGQVILSLNMGEFPSGQRGQTVNLLRLASMVRIHPLPYKEHFLLKMFFFCT